MSPEGPGPYLFLYSNFYIWKELTEGEKLDLCQNFCLDFCDFQITYFLHLAPT